MPLPVMRSSVGETPALKIVEIRLALLSMKGVVSDYNGQSEESEAKEAGSNPIRKAFEQTQCSIDIMQVHC